MNFCKLISFCVTLMTSILAQSQIITTIAGTGSSSFSGDGGPATAAGITNPDFGQFDKMGNFYFADMYANRIRKIDTNGIISTVAGSDHGGFGGDNGPATAAKLNDPQDVKLDSSGNLYIADISNFRIRKVYSATGIINTIAGNGTGGYYGDGGAATAAEFFGMQGLCLDKFGNIYVADDFNYRIRKINALGIISTFAGNGTGGYSGERTIADTSKVGVVSGLCSDTTGNIYFADNSNNRVFEINTSGIMYTVAGNGSPTYVSDGISATTASFSTVDVALDSFSNLFIADRYNNRAYKVDAATGILHNVAGIGVAGDGGDGGAATAASLNVPVGVTLDACGNLFISTIGGTMTGSGRRIRKVTFNTECDPYRGYNGALNIINPRPVPFDVSLFPVPANSFIKVVSEHAIQNVELYNIVGQLVATPVTLSEKGRSLDVSGIPPGVYFVRVTDIYGNETARVAQKE